MIVGWRALAHGRGTITKHTYSSGCEAGAPSTERLGGAAILYPGGLRHRSRVRFMVCVEGRKEEGGRRKLREQHQTDLWERARKR